MFVIFNFFCNCVFRYIDLLAFIKKRNSSFISDNFSLLRFGIPHPITTFFLYLVLTGMCELTISYIDAIDLF